MKISKTTIKLLLISLLVLSFLTLAGAQMRDGDDRIVVAGKYQLKESDLNRLTQVYEWMFAGKFTAAQRARYLSLAIAEAQANEQTAQSFASILQGFERIRTLKAEEREEFRRKILPEAVSALEAEKSELNDLLLEIYRSAQRGDAVADGVEPRNKSGKITPADLAGIWSTSSVSGERYRSLVTGELSDPSGSLIEYEISANGQVKYASYYSNTLYGCTTKLFVYKSGRLSVSGTNLVFDYAPGKRTTMTCTAATRKDATIPAERKTYPFRIERDEYGLKLCTLEDGSDFCLRKMKE